MVICSVEVHPEEIHPEGLVPDVKRRTRSCDATRRFYIIRLWAENTFGYWVS